MQGFYNSRGSLSKYRVGQNPNLPTDLKKGPHVVLVLIAKDSLKFSYCLLNLYQNL